MPMYDRSGTTIATLQIGRWRCLRQEWMIAGEVITPSRSRLGSSRGSARGTHDRRQGRSRHLLHPCPLPHRRLARRHQGRSGTHRASSDSRCHSPEHEFPRTRFMGLLRSRLCPDRSRYRQALGQELQRLLELVLQVPGRFRSRPRQLPIARRCCRLRSQCGQPRVLHHPLPRRQRQQVPRPHH